MWHQEVALVFREMDVGLYCFMMPHSAHILIILGRVLAAKVLFPLATSHPSLSFSSLPLPILSPPLTLLILYLRPAALCTRSLGRELPSVRNLGRVFRSNQW